MTASLAGRSAAARPGWPRAGPGCRVPPSRLRVPGRRRRSAAGRRARRPARPARSGRRGPSRGPRQPQCPGQGQCPGPPMRPGRKRARQTGARPPAGSRPVQVPCRAASSGCTPAGRALAAPPPHVPPPPPQSRAASPVRRSPRRRSPGRRSRWRRAPGQPGAGSQRQGHRAGGWQVRGQHSIAHWQRLAAGLLDRAGPARPGQPGQQAHPRGGRAGPPGHVPQPQRHPGRPARRARAAGRERVPARLERGKHGRGRLDGDQARGRRQRAVVQAGLHRQQIAVVVQARQRESGGPPVTRTGGERVLERVAPVLPGEAGAVRHGPRVPVDPDAAWPAAAGAHQGDVQRAVRRHQAARRTPVEQRHRMAGQIRDRRAGGAACLVAWPG